MLRLRRAMIALVVLGALYTFLSGVWIRPAPQQVALAPTIGATSTPVVIATLPPTPSITPVPPTPTLERRPPPINEQLKVAPTSFLPGSGPQLRGEQVAAGRRLDFYVGTNTFAPEQVERLAQDVEHALSYIQRRFQVNLTQRVSIGVYRTANAPKQGVRGMAYTSSHTINVFYRPEDDEHKALVVLSHELGHQLEAEYYGVDVQSRADTILHEGLATWISGEYWLSLSDSTSWQQRGQTLLASGINMNLATAERNGPDTAYESWASFIDYLTTRYGWDAFHQLYISSRGRACGSAKYNAIYGKSLKELNSEWVESLR